MSGSTPSVGELLEMIEEFLRDLATARLDGAARFQATVAANSLAIVRREVAARTGIEAQAADRLAPLLGRSGTAAELDAILCERIAAGSFAIDDPALLDHLLRSAAEQIAIDQPRYATLALLREQQASPNISGE